jgi:hypothetical protein
MSSKRSTTRKAAAVGLAVVGIAGLSLASAAQLNLGASTLGAATSVVASCQPAGTPITVSYTNTFNTTNSVGYKVTGVGLKGVDAACNNKSVKVSLLGAGDVSLGEVTGTATTGNATVLTAPPAGLAADAVVKVAVVITD